MSFGEISQLTLGAGDVDSLSFGNLSDLTLREKSAASELNNIIANGTMDKEATSVDVQVSIYEEDAEKITIDMNSMPQEWHGYEAPVVLHMLNNFPNDGYALVNSRDIANWDNTNYIDVRANIFKEDWNKPNLFFDNTRVKEIDVKLAEQSPHTTLVGSPIFDWGPTTGTINLYGTPGNDAVSVDANLSLGKVSLGDGENLLRIQGTWPDILNNLKNMTFDGGKGNKIELQVYLPNFDDMDTVGAQSVVENISSEAQKLVSEELPDGVELIIDVHEGRPPSSRPNWTGGTSGGF